MIRLVTLAEDYLKARDAWEIGTDEDELPQPADGGIPAGFAAEAEVLARAPLTLQRIEGRVARAFARRKDLEALSQCGPSTPQHAVHTKRVPQLGWDVKSYAARYARYLERTLGRQAAARIDPAPRIVIDTGSGILALGTDAGAARMAADFYSHDMEVMIRASAHDRYRAAPEAAIARAEFEYGGYAAEVPKSDGQSAL
jgi:rhamnose utilization protein RhaD (predicted bifunctional aldolase and dehydrogenase)